MNSLSYAGKNKETDEVNKPSFFLLTRIRM